MSEFEKELNALEDLASQLENDDIQMESAINTYSEAMKKAAKCVEILDGFEKKVSSIQKQETEILAQLTQEEKSDEH